MSDGPTSIRLSKAATEFNVGVSTILDFLKKKGHSIDSNPNTKLSPEMYNLLAKEYQPDKAAKDIANKLELEYQKEKPIKPEEKKAVSKDIPETIEAPIADEKTATLEKPLGKVPVTATNNELSAHGTGTIEPVHEKPTAKAKEKHDATLKPSEVSSQEKTIAEAETKPTESDGQAVTKHPETIEEKGKTDEFVENLPTGGPVVVGKIDLNQFKRKAKAKETEKKGTLEIAGSKDEHKGKKTHKKEEPASHAAIQAQPEETIATEAVGNIEVPNEIVPAIVGETPSPRATDQPSIDGLYDKNDANYLKTQVQKLEGPKIVSKIELPQPPRTDIRKPVASSTDEITKAKKRKRKRLNKNKPGTSVPATTTTTTAKPAERAKSGKPAQKGHIRHLEPKPEVTEEDIQKQLKETLQRLTGGGKTKASKYRREKRIVLGQHLQDEMTRGEEAKKILKVTEFVTANDLAVMMSVPVTQVIATCMSLGMFVSINQRLDAETIVLVSDEFGYKVEFVSVDIQDAIQTNDEDNDPAELRPRNPIVTVMGHVDHGKTSLLDHIRSANVIAGEAGGITQHIGAYEVQLNDGRKITFLDTPGHEAFTAMRARGAQVTDIVIIVVAADDTVMPQTKEAINHAQAAGVPMVFAINKIDKNGANPEKIREELSKLNILVEDWGGKYQSQEISAKKGTNVELLLDKVMLEAEMLDLHANPKAKASGTVIESSLDKGRGYVAKLLVQSGTLHLGDILLAGSVYGKVKAMHNERNQVVKEAGPSTPVLLLGLTSAPQAGDKFKVMSDEREAKQIASKRQQLQREQGIRTQKHITLDEIGRRIAIGDFKELNIIVKGDVDGSVEALSDSLLKLSTQQVQVNVIHKSVGAITESDVLLASASNAIIVGFQVRPSMSARKLAEREEIDIRLYSIIYTAINEIKLAIEGMLAPEIEEKIVCNVEIREVFRITKVGSIAGCMVLDGKITRNTRIRVIRDGIVVHTGSLGSLKRFKDDAREVLTGYECGLNIDNFNDIKIGDIVEGYEEVEVKKKL